MKILFYYIVIACLLQSAQVNGQNTPVSIGQKCPDAVLQLFHYQSPTARLSDFKNKLVILDFWATWCGGCIKSLKEYDALQKEFKDELIILPVTAQDRGLIEKFWRNNNIARNIAMPTVVGDKRLKSLFPHASVPHEVWIGKNGIVMAITTGEYVNAKNIRAALNGQKGELATKAEVDYDFSEPFLLKNATYKNLRSPVYYSAFSGHLPGAQMSIGLSLDTVDKNVRAYIVNNNIRDLYRVILEGTKAVNQNSHFILEVKDSLRFFSRLRKSSYMGDWEEKNTFCYEALVPLGTSRGEILASMRLDLNRYLKMNGRMETRDMECWVIKESDTNPAEDTKMASNHSMDDIVLHLNNVTRLPPVINESSHNRFVRLQDAEIILNTKKPTSEIMNQVFKGYGVHLLAEKRKIEVFVLTEL